MNVTRQGRFSIILNKVKQNLLLTVTVLGAVVTLTGYFTNFLGLFEDPEFTDEMQKAVDTMTDKNATYVLSLVEKSGENGIDPILRKLRHQKITSNQIHEIEDFVVYLSNEKYKDASIKRTTNHLDFFMKSQLIRGEEGGIIALRSISYIRILGRIAKGDLTVRSLIIRIRKKVKHSNFGGDVKFLLTEEINDCIKKIR
jgi:hypothetical protein